MNLVIHEVMKFHDVHDTVGHFTVERFTCATVIKGYLTGHRQSCLPKQVEGLFFGSPIENRGRQVYAAAVLLGKFENIGLLGSLDEFARLLSIQILLEPSSEPVDLVAMAAHQFVNLLPETSRRPTQMGLKNLSDIHSRRNP